MARKSITYTSSMFHPTHAWGPCRGPVQGIHVKFRFSTCAVHVVGTQCVYFHGVKFCEKEDKFLQLALHAYVVYYPCV